MNNALWCKWGNDSPQTVGFDDGVYYIQGYADGEVKRIVVNQDEVDDLGYQLQRIKRKVEKHARN